MTWMEKQFDDENVSKKGVTVKLGLPTVVSEGKSAICSIELIYHDTNEVETEIIPGIDGFQAIELSFKYIRQRLLAYPGKLTSENMCVEEVFPYSIDPFLGRFSRTMERVVQDRINDFHQRRGKRLEGRYRKKKKY